MDGFTVDSVYEAYEAALIKWAGTYNGYERLAHTPEGLDAVLTPLTEAYRTTGSVPEWAGVDLLRGWAFYCYRAHRWSGHGPLLEEFPEMALIVEAIRNHPGAKARDMAPAPPRQ